jgi:hypothetical protein
MERLHRVELSTIGGEALAYPTYTVTPLSLEIFEGFRVSAALYAPKSKAKAPGFLMAHGHFGEGKSSGEAQAPAHALASRGFVVLAVDTPGVEEGDRPNRQIHHQAGAKNREALEAAGTSAMALQLHGLQAGLDYLEEEAQVDWIAVGGASGGAVQAFYLAHIDTRTKALVMASFVSMPRQTGEGGCPCDRVPGGWPQGQDLIAELPIPSLWLSEGAQQKPPSLPKSAQFEMHPGPHGFERPMIESTVAWLEKQAGRSNPAPLLAQLPHSPSTALASSTIGANGIAEILQTPVEPKSD